MSKTIMRRISKNLDKEIDKLKNILSQQVTWRDVSRSEASECLANLINKKRLYIKKEGKRLKINLI